MVDTTTSIIPTLRSAPVSKRQQSRVPMQQWDRQQQEYLEPQQIMRVVSVRLVSPRHRQTQQFKAPPWMRMQQLLLNLAQHQ